MSTWKSARGAGLARAAEASTPNKSTDQYSLRSLRVQGRSACHQCTPACSGLRSCGARKRASVSPDPLARLAAAASQKHKKTHCRHPPPPFSRTQRQCGTSGLLSACRVHGSRRQTCPGVWGRGQMRSGQASDTFVPCAPASPPPPPSPILPQHTKKRRPPRSSR